jgi:hypothetical protein
MNDTKKITDKKIADAARSIGVEPAILKSFALTEANGSGFSDTGKCKILFEGHIFWKLLTQAGINPLVYEKQNPNILYPKWDKTKYLGGDKEYGRLAVAQVINNDLALSSTSWGMFQIMGFNYVYCGYSNVRDFVKAMQESELHQLNAVIKFLGKNIIQHLKDKNFVAIASLYNGPKFRENNYHVKLENNYNKSLYMNNL